MTDDRSNVLQEVIEIDDEEESGEPQEPKPKEPQLSEEQLDILEKVKQRQNIFITGSAGVGKSFVLKEIIKALPRESTYVTASTGVAACNISGITLHSFAGIGLGTSSVKKLLSKIRGRKEVRQRWLDCRALVIDEISMIDGKLFEKIEEIARMVRGNSKPFGGIQLILCGDFLQLPPVQADLDLKKFCFEVSAWKSCVQRTILLKKVFRQKEEALIGMLNRIRLGELTLKDSAQLQKCRFTKFNQDDGIKPTRLFPHRASCDHVNQEQINALPEKLYSFTSKDNGHPIYLEQLNKYSRFPKVLHLKVGAQVMLLKNLNVSSGLVNGARGVVTRFLSEKERVIQMHGGGDPECIADIKEQMDKTKANNIQYPVVKFTNGIEMTMSLEKSSIEIAGREVASREQVPLALAWAVSIHKSQGMTLERVELSLSNVFEFGQAYVALSRCTSVSGLKINDFRSSVVKAHPKVLGYYKELSERPVESTDTQNSCFENMTRVESLITELRQSSSTPSRTTGETVDSPKLDLSSPYRRDLEPRSHVTSNSQPTVRNEDTKRGRRNFRGFLQNSSSNRSRLFSNKTPQGSSIKAFFQPMKRHHSLDSDFQPKLKERKFNNESTTESKFGVFNSKSKSNEYEVKDTEIGNRSILIE